MYHIAKRPIRLFISLLFWLFSSTFFCLAQAQSEILTNANIVALVKAGLSKSVIASTIKNSQSKFDVSTNGMITLKKDGVPDELIDIMVNKTSNGINAGPNSSTVQNLASTGGEELNALEAGIYYDDENLHKKVQMDGSIFSQAKTGSGIMTALTYGIAKTKSKAVLSGAQANLQLNNSTPVFYFIFPHNNGGNIGNEANSGGWYSNATSPNEFLLIKFKVNKKGREVVTGSFGSYSGFSSGIDDDNKVAYRSTKLASGIYKVYLESPLKQGEYAFIFAGTASTAMGGTSSQKAFDFSVTK